MKKESPIAWLYFFCGLMNLLAQLLSSNHLASWTKPFLMPVLILLIVVESTPVRKPVKWLIAALTFSWLGDVALMLSEYEASFMVGLASFLVAHLIYIWIFVQSSNAPIKPDLKLVWPLLIFGGFLLFYLLPNTGDLLIPVIIYAMVLLVMVATAWHRVGRTSTSSYAFTLYGAGCFMLSDSVLAINKFAIELPFGSFLVMLLYIPAQYLIVKGILEHQKNQST